ncbi:MAG: DUF2202 domain-containing protein [Methanosarcinales archaeon]|nr:DUF2202 domain-containing protein [Methanosarcinales archaeon]
MRSGLFVFAVMVLALLCGCLQPPAPPEVSEKAATEEWKPDGVVGENEYSRSMVLLGSSGYAHSGGNLELSWKNDQEHLYMALAGRTAGWLSVGFDPQEWMKDADTILGYVDGEKAVVEDQYSVNNYGPHPGDGELGGTDDILEYGGREENGTTVVEFRRKLDTGDRYDRALAPGESVSIIWGMADSDDPTVKHNVAHGEGILVLEQAVAGQEATVSVSTLTDGERKGILFIREEEKAARDIYMSLYQVYPIPVFKNIATSEQNHMDQVKILVDRYGLNDPVQDAPGAFFDPDLKAMYDRMTKEGKRSQADALKAGAAVEEINILDLEEQIAGTEKDDLQVVYQGLLAGSRKHLRSFVRVMDAQGLEYQPQHLSPEQYREIVE